MTVLRLALLQLHTDSRDPATNQAKADGACRRAADQGAHLALMPEMWSHGYHLPDPHDPAAVEAWADSALPPEHPYLRHFQAVAAELEMAIGATWLEAGDRPRNSLTIFDRHGTPVLTYAKVHTCAFDREVVLGPGDDLPVATLDTPAGPVVVGAMICFDREFPEAARVLALRGAELVLVPNCCDMELNRLTQLRSRAFENKAAMALANHAAPTCNGHSVVYDGMAFTAEGESRDMTVVEADEGEGVWLAELDLEALREYRQREPWGAPYRRPEVYGELV